MLVALAVPRMLMKSMVGKADYAADGVWCASEMLKLAINPEVDMQKAVQIFGMDRTSAPSQSWVWPA
ncbi:hypothetical protein ALQ30_200242 [Pseudomonas syringae pv. persicae]|uniref:Uncharacterized protein n=2 Tax=Pseudomonas syringae group genomosp. 3 TaxID=251701 RepID=A0A3M4AIA2_9PSED|nr:hypothetical protein ALQ30_200242 [Pseudomonas syringae pv. persicae]